MVQLIGNLMAKLSALEATFVERVREATDRQLRAGEDVQWYTEQLEIIRQIKADVAVQLGKSDAGQVEPAGGEPDISRAREPRVDRIARLREEFGEQFPFFEPDKDENGVPTYAESVMSGLGSNRERAWAAAQVYGERLREAALAEAIFRTGDTNAKSPEAVRGSLGGLVRYGDDWTRERGDLVYRGEGLRPNLDAINRLLRERNEASAMDGQDENISQKLS